MRTQLRIGRHSKSHHLLSSIKAFYMPGALLFAFDDINALHCEAFYVSLNRTFLQAQPHIFSSRENRLFG